MFVCKKIKAESKLERVSDVFSETLKLLRYIAFYSQFFLVKCWRLKSYVNRAVIVNSLHQFCIDVNGQAIVVSKELEKVTNIVLEDVL